MDPIVEEVRVARQKHSAQFNYDLRKIAEDLRMKGTAIRPQDCLFSSQTSKKKGGGLISQRTEDFGVANYGMWDKGCELRVTNGTEDTKDASIERTWR